MKQAHGVLWDCRRGIYIWHPVLHYNQIIRRKGGIAHRVISWIFHVWS